MCAFEEEFKDRELSKYLKAVSNCCVGDGMVDFRRFFEGLEAAPGTTCAICYSDMSEGQLATLPCCHSFHFACLCNWEGDGAVLKNAECPVCRQEAPLPIGQYHVDPSKQLVLRLREWFITAMCQRCQARYQEADPMIVVGTNNLMVRQSQLNSGDFDMELAFGPKIN
jgi:hypothetical protein